jgi:PKD repeat protein
MPLFVRKTLLAGILSLFTGVGLFAQNCSPFPVYFPDTVCLGQKVTGLNNGSTQNTYSWDMCAGDFFKPGETVGPLLPSITAGSWVGFKTIKMNGKYYGFTTHGATGNVYRLDFDTSLASVPSTVNLGNPGNALSTPAGMELLIEGDILYAFVTNQTNGQIVRLKFGNGVLSAPTAVSYPITGIGTAYCISVIKDNGQFFGFTYSYSNKRLITFTFGANIESAPTILATLNTGGSLGAGLIPISDCSGKYVFHSDLSGKIIKVKFGNSYTNTSPVSVTLPTPTFSGGLYAIQTLQDGGRKLLLGGSFGGGGVCLYNFGSNYQSDNPSISTVITSGVSNISGFTNEFLVGQSTSRVLCMNNTGTFFKLEFGAGNCSTGGLTKQYNPPSFTPATSGKQFINYSYTTPEGEKFEFGDSIFVRTVTSTEDAPSPTFITDDQCPSRTTKFYPFVLPAGNYSYNWNFPGNNSSLQNPSFQFSSPGIYPVTLTVRATNGCGVSNVTRNVKIYPNPTIAITSDFLIPGQVCTKDSVLFQDASSPQTNISRWKWDFGNNNLSFIQNPKAYFQFNQAGQTIQVSLKASDSSGCGTPVIKPIIPVAGADVQFTFSQLCKGENTQFLNTTSQSGVSSFLWNFDDPSSGSNNVSSSNATQLTHAFTDTGSYSVRLKTISNNGCSSQLVQTVKIYPLPEAEFQFPAFVFPGNTVSFTNKSKAQNQTILSQEWLFGDPSSGSQNVSTEINPNHTYTNAGEYQVQLTVKTDQNCLGSKTKTLYSINECPIISYSKSVSSSGDYDTTVILTETQLIKETYIDFCAGDLEYTPVLQSQQSGNSPIASALQIVPVKDGNTWVGFIPAPVATNSTCFFKANIGSTLNNDISNFSTSLGSLQNRFSNPNFIKFYKEDSTWYAFACNSDNKLWRIKFGTSIDNNSPNLSEIVLPAGTLVNPTAAQIIHDNDTTYLIIVNNNNLSTNNVVQIRFAGSVSLDPSVHILSNPLVLQNSNGFFNLSFARNCRNWHGFLLAKSQLYRLDFGKSLSNSPVVTALTSDITAGLNSANGFDNCRGISMIQDLGTWYALINYSNGTLIRAKFGNGLNQPPNVVSSLGSFGVTGTVGPFHFVQERSEVFGIVINNSGTIYKIKFPNLCSTNTPYITRTTSGSDSSEYQESGKYYITITSVSGIGTATQVVDSVDISTQNLNLTCKQPVLNHPELICFDYTLNPYVQGGHFDNGKWDFCTGDFKLPPSVLSQPVGTNTTGVTGIQVVQSGTNYYVFQANSAGISRLNLGTDPSGIPGIPIQVTLPNGGTSFSSLADFKIIKEGSNWFALCIFLNGDGMLRLNFGPDITNVNPSFATLNLPGFLAKPRGLDIFEDKGKKYALIANQTSGALTLLNFGPTYRNIPFPMNIDVPSAVNLYKVSVIRDCNIWHAFISDQAQDSIYHLTFNRGLQSKPKRSMLPLVDGSGLKAIKDGNLYYLIATKTQTNFNNVYKFSFGTSLSNDPLIDSLGNFPSTTPISGMQRVETFHLYQNEKSNYYLFGTGIANGSLYRIKFQNPCSAEKPIAFGDTVAGQIYRNDGKFFYSYEGFDQSGDLVSNVGSVTVQNLVDADFTIPGNRCKGEPILFQDASTTGQFTSITNWKWHFGDSTSTSDTSLLPNPTHTFAKAGIYQVRLRVRETGGCINEILRSVVVAEKPRPDFIAGNGGVLCTNDSILFQDATTSQNDPISEHTWEIKKDNNLIASSSLANPKFFFAETGTYSVMLKVKGESQCDSSMTKTIIVGGIGSLVRYTNPSACLGEAVTFTPNITGPPADSVRWFVDAPSYNVGTNPFIHTFNSTDDYIVALTVYNQQCANTFSKVIKVGTRPSFAISAQAPLNCQGLPVNFSASLSSAGSITYNWNFGDGTTDTVGAPIKIFAESGTYNVILNLQTSNGCDAADTISFTAKRAPKAFFTFDKACKDEPVTFSNQSTANGIPGGITSYLWEFGSINLETSTDKDPSPFLYNEPPGTKTVKLTVRTAEDCPNSYTVQIPIGPKIAANYRKDAGCIGTPFRFYDITSSGNDPIVSWEWAIGGLNYSTKNPIVEFDQKGTYDVHLKVTSQSGCVDEVNRSADFTVLDQATADFSFTSTYNPPSYRVVFTQLPEPNPSYDYIWDFGDSSSSTAANPPPHFYKKEGNYIVTLKAVRSGTICSTEVQKVVNVIINPVQGIKIRKITVAKGSEKIAMAAEVENQSNIALRSFDMVARIGNLTTQKETWTGILLPGAVVQYNFKSDVLYKNGQKIPFICLTSQLTDPSKETSEDDNSQCATLDSVPSFVGVFPNPAVNSTTVELSIINNDPIEIRLMNTMGQELIRYEDDSPTAGPYRKTFDTSKLSDGMYYIWFRSGDIIENRKLLISKE